MGEPGGGQVVINGVVTVNDWRSSGQTTIDGGKITADTIDCAALTTSTLNAKTITLGTTGSNGIIKSANYVADTSGFQVDGAGNAEFNSVKVRGTLYTSEIAAGQTLTLNATAIFASSNFSDFPVGAGWQLTSNNGFRGNSVTVIGANMTILYLYPTSALTLTTALFVTPDGLNLQWQDANSNVHTIV